MPNTEQCNTHYTTSSIELNQNYFTKHLPELLKIHSFWKIGPTRDFFHMKPCALVFQRFKVITPHWFDDLKRRRCLCCLKVKQTTTRFADVLKGLSNVSTTQPAAAAATATASSCSCSSIVRTSYVPFTLSALG